MSKKRRGRTREPNARRRQTTREGQGRLDNLPPPEQIHRKAAILGVKVDGIIGLRKLMQQSADCPLDVLLARKIIDRQQYDSACTFAALYWRHIGEWWPKRRDGATPTDNPDRDKAIEDEFNRQHEIVTALGDAAYNHFAGPVVGHEWPSWLFRYIEAKEPSRAFSDLLRGINALVKYRRGENR